MTGTSSIPIILVLIIIVRTKRLINKFKKLGAINEENAKTLDELKISRRLIFRKYLFHDIIIETNQKYYLDELNLKKYKAKKRMILIPLIVITLLVFIYLDIIFS